jgi:hypothetical protein
LRQNDCPPELKILVADMLTAYDQYKQGHACLFTARTHEEIQKAARDTVENFLENRRIWKELNHYKEKGVILGEHPIFFWMRRLDEIRGMKVGDLVNLKIRLGNNLVRNRAAVRKHPDHTQTMNRKQRIIEMEKELTEVNRLLNL